MKTEERQLRAAGMTEEAAKLRKRWRKLTLDYQLYSIDHKRAFYRYRCVIDRAEVDEFESNAFFKATNIYSNEETLPLMLVKHAKISYTKTNDNSEQYHREVITLNEITSKKGKNIKYAQKMISSYYDFREQKIEMSYHALNRFLGQKKGKGKQPFTKEDVIYVYGQPANYVQEDGRLIKYYNNLCVVINKKTQEIVSIISKAEPKQSWRKL